MAAASSAARTKPVSRETSVPGAMIAARRQDAARGFVGGLRHADRLGGAGSMTRLSSDSSEAATRSQLRLLTGLHRTAPDPHVDPPRRRTEQDGAANPHHDPDGQSDLGGPDVEASRRVRPGDSARRREPDPHASSGLSRRSARLPRCRAVARVRGEWSSIGSTRTAGLSARATTWTVTASGSPLLTVSGNRPDSLDSARKVGTGHADPGVRAGRLGARRGR